MNENITVEYRRAQSGGWLVLETHPSKVLDTDLGCNMIYRKAAEYAYRNQTETRLVLHSVPPKIIRPFTPDLAALYLLNVDQALKQETSLT